MFIYRDIQTIFCCTFLKFLFLVSGIQNNLLYILGETFAGLSVLPLSGFWCYKIPANINTTNAFR